MTGTTDPHAADRELIRKFLAGDAGTIALVRSWVRSQVSRALRSGSTLEDLEQDVLVDLLEALETDRFRGDSRFETFVRSFSRFKGADRLRAAGRRTQVPIEDQELADEGPSPADFTRRRADVELARKVMGEMDPGCRELWAMIHDGLSYAEMSSLTGVSEGAVRVRVHRCRQKALQLRQRLEARNS